MADLEFSWLDALCRAAATNLPRGARGVEAAQLFLAAFPEACRRGLGDTTDSAPGLFGALVGLGILQGLPGEGAMTAAIRLIAATTELITPRSPRRWTTWYGSARDLDTPLGARLRAQVTPAMMRAPTPSPSPVRRRESIQRERDRLATELAAARRDLAAVANDRDRTLADLAAAANDRDRLNTELAAARNSQAAAANDRDRLAADLTTAHDQRDDLASQLAALATDRARLFDDLQNTRKVLARARRDLAATKESLDLTTRERSERAEELRLSESKRDNLAEELRLSESKRDDLAEELARSTADRDTLAKSLAVKTAEAAAQAKSLEVATRTNETLTAQVDLLTTDKRAEDELRRANAARRQAEAEVKQLRREVQELKGTVSNIQNALSIPDRGAEPLLIASNNILDRIKRLREGNQQLIGTCVMKATDLACAELRIELLKGKAGNAYIEDEYERRLPDHFARAKSKAHTMLAPFLVFT